MMTVLHAAECPKDDSAEAARSPRADAAATSSMAARRQAGGEPNPPNIPRKLRENPAHGPLTHREKAFGPPRTLDLPAVND